MLVSAAVPLEATDAQMMVMKTNIPALEGTILNPIPWISTSSRVTTKILSIAMKTNLTKSQAMNLIDIAKCESGYDQQATHSNADIITDEVWSTDFGVFQINDHYFDKEMRKHNLEYKTSEDDNIAAGVLIYKEQGSAPWIASKAGCWGKEVVGW